MSATSSKHHPLCQGLPLSLLKKRVFTTACCGVFPHLVPIPHPPALSRAHSPTQHSPPEVCLPSGPQGLACLNVVSMQILLAVPSLVEMDSSFSYLSFLRDRKEQGEGYWVQAKKLKYIPGIT